MGNSPSPTSAQRLLDLLKGVQKDVDRQVGELSALLQTGKSSPAQLDAATRGICKSLSTRLRTTSEAIRLLPVKDAKP